MKISSLYSHKGLESAFHTFAEDLPKEEVAIYYVGPDEELKLGMGMGGGGIDYAQYHFSIIFWSVLSNFIYDALKKLITNVFKTSKIPKERKFRIDVFLEEKNCTLAFIIPLRSLKISLKAVSTIPTVIEEFSNLSNLIALSEEVTFNWSDNRVWVLAFAR